MTAQASDSTTEPGVQKKPEDAQEYKCKKGYVEFEIFLPNTQDTSGQKPKPVGMCSEDAKSRFPTLHDPVLLRKIERVGQTLSRYGFTPNALRERAINFNHWVDIQTAKAGGWLLGK